jgi:hypothetical protein
MRMARAFIASVPLALVLVAAVVVPIALTPGTFGFHHWPSARGGELTPSEVRVSPLQVAAAPARPARAPEATRRPAPTSSVLKHRSSPASRAPARPAPDAAGSPERHRSHEHAGARGLGDGATPPAPASSPGPPLPAPQSPASEADAPPADGLAAVEDLPVLRGEPAADPIPPPPPVEDDRQGDSQGGNGQHRGWDRGNGRSLDGE